MTKSGYILVSNDLSGFVVAFIFGHFSSKGKVRWIFVGILISLAACLMQSGTQLLVKVLLFVFYILFVFSIRSWSIDDL